jgi:hypothetical protein
MHILKTLKPIRMNGEIVLPGHTVKAVDGQALIEKGYARRLTQKETQTILDDYVRYAENLFSETLHKKSISANREHKAFYQERLL